MKNLQFLFVAPKVAKAKQQHPFPYGIAYVTAVMKEHGFNVFCLDLSFSDTPVEEQLEVSLRQNKIDVVCTGGMSIEFREINEVIDVVKRIDKRLVTVVGGAIITSDPAMAVENMKIDYAVRGEGEYTMVELAASLCRGEVPENVAGLAWLGADKKMVLTGERKTITDLDALPWPDYDGFEFERHLPLMKPNSTPFQVLDMVQQANIITSRSCPFSCTFCYHPLGKVYRQRSMDNVFLEIDMLVAKYRINAMEIMDELFSAKKPRMLEFAERIKKYNISWIAQLRVRDVDAELLQILKNAGLVWISYGIENVDDRILLSMKKKITAAEINRALKLTREARIGLTGNILFGDPQETEESINVSLEWWKKNPQYDIALNPIVTVPDAPIYQYAVKKGLVKNKFEHMLNRFPIINLTKIPDKDFKRLLSKIRSYQVDERYHTRGRVLESIRIGPDAMGDTLYTVRLQIPCRYT